MKRSFRTTGVVRIFGAAAVSLGLLFGGCNDGDSNRSSLAALNAAQQQSASNTSTSNNNSNTSGTSQSGTQSPSGSTGSVSNPGNSGMTQPSSGSTGATTQPSSGSTSGSTSTQPSSGTTTQPSSGTTTQPSSGTTTQPSSGTTTQPSNGTSGSSGATTQPSSGNSSSGTAQPGPGAGGIGSKTASAKKDSDKDGIWDMHDLSPKWGKVHMNWKTRFPRGAIHFKKNIKAYGLYGSSKIFKTKRKFFFGKKISKTEIYSGKQGTRSSIVYGSKVRKRLKKVSKDFQPISTRYKGREKGISRTYKYGGGRIIRKQYELSYDITPKVYETEFQNETSQTVRDHRKDRFEYTEIPFNPAVVANHEVIFQVSMHASKDRTKSSKTGKSYTALAFRYVLLPERVSRRGEVRYYEGQGVATGLNDHAYQVSLRIPAKELKRVAKGGNVRLLATPVWVTGSNNNFSSVHAVEAVNPTHLTVGALALQTSAGKTTQTVTVKAPYDLTRTGGSGRTQATTSSRWVIRVKKKNGKLQYIVDRVKVSKKLTFHTRRVLKRVKYSTLSSKTVDNLNKVGLTAKRYDMVMDGLRYAHAGTYAVIDGYNAYIAYRNGDWVKGTFFAARGSVGALMKVATGRFLVPLKIGFHIMHSGYKSYVAFQNGDKVEGSLYLGKMSMGILWVTKGSTALPIGFGHTLALGTAMKVGMGAIEVTLDLYRASKTKDSIKKQGYYEDAAATVIDTGIMLIPGYGMPTMAVWTLTTLVADIATGGNNLTIQIWSTPGSLLTHVGVSWFTKKVPTTYANDAFRKASKLAETVVKNQLQAKKSALLIMPKIN